VRIAGVALPRFVVGIRESPVYSSPRLDSRADQTCSSCGAALAQSDVLYTPNARVVCATCFAKHDLKASQMRANKVGISIVVVVGIVALKVGVRQWARESNETTTYSVGGTTSPEPVEEAALADPQRVANDDPALCLDRNACFALGERLREQDAERSIAAYRHACELGSLGGCSNAARMLADGSGSARHPVAAVALFQRGCDLGEPTACQDLAMMLNDGDGVAKDPTRARLLWQKACDGNDAAGCHNAGFAFEHGIGGAKDDSKARAMFAKACGSSALTSEDFESCAVSGSWLMTGRGGTRDPKRGIAYLQKACDGDSKLCVDYARVLQYGIGVARDAARARELHARACNHGEPKACNDLGDLLNRGIGGKQDKAAAKRRFEQACDGGEQTACVKMRS
jgi:TPR repeat protein